MLYDFEPTPGPDSPQEVRMVVEIPKESSNKYEFDFQLKLFRLARSLYSPLHYPGDYGFLPGTIAADGEPLDVLCMANTPSFTGCLLYVRPVGVLDMLDGTKRDHKILAAHVHDPRHDQLHRLANVNQHRLAEIEHFFGIYKELEGTSMTMGGWRDVEAAHQVINESRERYLAQQGQTVPNKVAKGFA